MLTLFYRKQKLPGSKLLVPWCLPSVVCCFCWMKACSCLLKFAASLTHVSWEISAHSSLENLPSSSIFDGLLVWSMVFSSPHRFSMQFKSGLYLTFHNSFHLDKLCSGNQCIIFPPPCYTVGTEFFGFLLSPNMRRISCNQSIIFLQVVLSCRSGVFLGLHPHSPFLCKHQWLSSMRLQFQLMIS